MSVMNDMKDKIYMVKNRSTSVISYRIPDMRVRRVFQPGEVKKISGEELEMLSYQDGGKLLFINYLQVLGAEAKEIMVESQPEYNMSEEDIKELILHGSQDAFLDFLDFAPMGAMDILKDLAVKLPMNDLAKREALKNKTGFDVTKALANLEDEKAVAAAEGATTQTEPAAAPVRRTSASTSKYKVVSTGTPTTTK